MPRHRREATHVGGTAVVGGGIDDAGASRATAFTSRATAISCSCSAVNTVRLSVCGDVDRGDQAALHDNGAQVGRTAEVDLDAGATSTVTSRASVPEVTL